MAGAQACRRRHEERLRRAPRRSARSGLAWWVAFWVFAALLLTGIGIYIATVLESGLLGFLGADFIFLVAVSIYTSGQGRSPQGRH